MNDEVLSFETKTNKTIDYYLLMVSKTANRFYFTDSIRIPKKARVKQDFEEINPIDSNYYLVQKERLLNGCTRAYLINPILKELFDNHNIETDWQYGNTYSNHYISNIDYEYDSLIEFVVFNDEGNIGYKYTDYGKNQEEIIDYFNTGERFSDFKKTNHLTNVIIINWSYNSDQKERVGRDPSNYYQNPDIISPEQFFLRYFSKEEYDFFRKKTAEAIKKAKRILAFDSIQNLVPNNILAFKSLVLNDTFSEEKISNKYSFINKSKYKSYVFTEDDKRIIDNNFFERGLKNAVVGNADFAKCFITSEYLFRTIDNQISIDYTSVVTGYLKSVEQLLYRYYLSFFGGETEKKYWEIYRKPGEKDHNNKSFDENLDEFRFAPYDKRIKLKYSEYDIRKGKDAPALKELCKIIRNNEAFWYVSPKGKEFIYSCLNDYCSNCRNEYFHKDNIFAADYDDVVRIRDNTIICLYYILGAFKLLDNRLSEAEQLNIIDYTFDKQYAKLLNEPEDEIRYYWIKIKDGYCGPALYLPRDVPPKYDTSGLIIDEITFVKIDDSILQNNDCSYILSLKEDLDYVTENMIKITRESLILELEKKRFKH